MLEPAFLFDISTHGAYAVVRAQGELDIAAVPRLQLSIRRAARRSPRVIVDLRHVDFMDTVALSALQRESKMVPWTLHCIAGPGIQRLLDLAGGRQSLRWIAPEQLAR
jgi:anti-anti-sigma factor